MTNPYDALLVVSFGGPEGPEEVMPFLENVLRGKNVPRRRMEEVAEHYRHFGGVSPLNEQNRRLIAAARAEFEREGLDMPIYWGNRNWHPLLEDTIRRMRDEGVRRALAFFTSAYSSYSGCRQYRENIEAARAAVGHDAPVIEKLRSFFNHPGFVRAATERVAEAVDQVPADRRETAHVVYTAHSIPLAMARGCAYAAQLAEVARLIDESLAVRAEGLTSSLVYQSRSGPPSQPWLEPDVCDYLKEIAGRGRCTDIVIAPIGFLSDHMEILFDLDTEARELCERTGLNMVRAGTVGTHPDFVRMIPQLVRERTEDIEPPVVGRLAPVPDVCPVDCCPSGRPSAESRK